MTAAVSFRREMMDGVLRSVGPGRQDAFLPSPALQNHAASLARLPGGGLACVWFGGTMEGMPDISVHMSVLDEAAGRWSPAKKLVDDPARSEQNPLLHMAADGSVWLLYTSQISGNQETSVVRRRISRDGGKNFGAAHTLIDVPGTFIRQRIVTLPSGGEMLLPAFQCRKLAGERWTGNRDTSAVFRSADGGGTWTESPVPGSLGQVHMNIVPLGGSRMLALFRSRWADFIHRSRSEDNGASWSAAAPTDLPNNNSSIQCIRLADGRLALAYNHSSAANAEGRRTSLYDEIEGVSAPAAETTGRQAFWGAPRAPMSLVFSDDGGETWSDRRDLETGDGYCLSNNSVDSINREFSYPTLLEAPGGQIDIAFTYFRQGIKHVRLSI